MLKNLISKDLYNNFVKIISLINNSENIIITAHENPDGDSIGSSLAMRNYLLSKGKNADIYFYNSIPDCYKFMSGADEINIYNVNDESKIINADLIIILDVNSLARLRTVGEAICKSNAKRIMIDHHLNPEDLAELVAINSNASATGELIWQMMHLDNSFEIDQNTAEAIYISILTDTGGFRFQNTNQFAHLIAADLLQYGVDPTSIYDQIYNQMEQKVLKQLGKTYSNSELELNGKFHILTVTKQDMLELGLLPEDLNNFSESTLLVKGVLAGVLISEIPGEDSLKLSFRSKANINIRQIAEQYGGGGHINAAGAKVKTNDILALKKELIEKIKVLLF